MPRHKTSKSVKPVRSTRVSSESHSEPAKKQSFRLEFKNPAQRAAWNAIENHDVSFLLGPAGCGKTFLAVAYAINEVLARRKKKIILTRPIVEAGESLGFLPGDANEKVYPYMIPMYDSIVACVGEEGSHKDIIDRSIEVAPIAFQRGRAETLDSPIVTPSGIVPMGEIKVGDKVIGSCGKPINVTGVFPQGVKRIYKVSFNDRTFVKCSEDHLWSTMTISEKIQNKGFSVKSTKEIRETLTTKDNQKNHLVPTLTGPVEFNAQKIKMNPYVMGLFLSNADIDFSSNNKKYIRSLFGDKPNKKRLPDAYKFNSVEVRLEVLRGYLECSGCMTKKVNGNITIQLQSTSKQIVKDIVFLCRSLGGMAHVTKEQFDFAEKETESHVNVSYNVYLMMSINPFNFQENKTQNNLKFTKLITSVEYIGEEKCQCISVDADDHLYITNGFNITHNTFRDAVCIFDEAQNATKAQLKLFLTRFGENSKVIITGDPFQSDLTHNDRGLMPTVESLRDLEGITIIEFGASSIVRHPLIGAILERLEEKIPDYSSKKY